jgi:hypothetical protein
MVDSPVSWKTFNKKNTPPSSIIFLPIFYWSKFLCVLKGQQGGEIKAEGKEGNENFRILKKGFVRILFFSLENITQHRITLTWIRLHLLSHFQPGFLKLISLKLHFLFFTSGFGAIVKFMTHNEGKAKIRRK